jgi:hypothetical protein
MSGQRIEFRIDELILHGFSSGDRHRVGEAVKRELVRLMSGPGASFAPKNTKRIDMIRGGDITLSPATRPESAGTQIAQAVHDGIAPKKNR